MTKKAQRARIFVLSLAGAAGGYLFLHPYAMIVIGHYDRHGGNVLHAHSSGFLQQLPLAFQLEMLPMGIPFGLLGAATGLSLGSWLMAKEEKFEIEKRLCAVETVKQLMVTLAHHLLNAVQVVGGISSYCLKRVEDDSLRHNFEIIKEEAWRIEAVVKSLQSLESVETERYVKDSETLIIDIRKQLDERLNT